MASATTGPEMVVKTAMYPYRKFLGFICSTFASLVLSWNIATIVPTHVDESCAARNLTLSAVVAYVTLGNGS